MSPARTVVLESDIAPAAGQQVEVRGLYTPIALGRRPTAEPPPTHVAVQLADGTRVLLEPPWREPACRAAEERSVFDGRLVRAVGTILVTVPEEFEGAQTPLLPCLVDVVSVTAGDG
jgi:hypothetical protein